MTSGSRRLGLVLGAGGPVGHAFHAGVLAALADSAHLDARSAEIIVGTSAGAVVTALLRAGLGAEDIFASIAGGDVSGEGAEILGRTTPVTIPLPDFEHVDFLHGPASARGILSTLRRPWAAHPGALAAAALPAGKISAGPIRDSLAGLFPVGWPEAAAWICAVRLDDAVRVVFARLGAGRASLAEAVSASCAVPAFFAPVTIAGVRYVDGGVWSATNLDLLADHRLELVIVSSPMSGLGRSPAAAAGAINRIRLRREMAALRRTGVPVIVFEPSAADLRVMGSNFMDGRRLAEVAVQARRSAVDHLQRSPLPV